MLRLIHIHSHTITHSKSLVFVWQTKHHNKWTSFQGQTKDSMAILLKDFFVFSAHKNNNAQPWNEGSFVVWFLYAEKDSLFWDWGLPWITFCFYCALSSYLLFWNIHNYVILTLSIFVTIHKIFESQLFLIIKDFT